MKYLLILFFTFPACACMNRISISDAKKVIEAQSYQVAETLTYLGEDGICFDGKSLLESDLIDGELIPNPDKKFARENSEKKRMEEAKAKEEKCKAFSFKGTTIAQLRQELNESMECKK